MNPLSESTRRTLLAIVLLTGLVIRIGWASRQSNDPAVLEKLPDQREYLEAGQNLLHRQVLSIEDPRFGQTVFAYRSPGYPILVACCGGVAGVTRITQSFLDVSSILAIYLLARRWLPERGALLAAAIVAIDPFLIFFSGLILSETLFTALMCWGMALLALSHGPLTPGKKRWGWLAGGTVLALGVLVRPGAMGIPVVLGLGGALMNWREARTYRSGSSLPVAATMFLLTAAVLLPWAARNRWVLGTWVWSSTNDGITRYDGFNPDATGASDQRFVEWMPWTKDMTELGRSRYFARLADEWIEAHPLEAFRLALVKIGRTWSPVPLSAEYRSRWIYWVVGLTFSLILDLLVLVGLRWGSLPAPVKRFLLLPAVYLTVAATLSVGSLRYRIPADGPMAILAAGALCSAKRDREDSSGAKVAPDLAARTA